MLKNRRCNSRHDAITPAVVASKGRTKFSPPDSGEAEQFCSPIVSHCTGSFLLIIMKKLAMVVSPV